MSRVKWLNMIGDNDGKKSVIDLFGMFINNVTKARYIKQYAYRTMNNS